MNKRLAFVAMAVAVLVVAAIATRFFQTADDTAVARIDGYAIASDPRQLVLRVDMGTQAKVIGETVVEDAEKVTITVHITNPRVFDEGRFVAVTVTLKEPLGSRRLVDGATGRVVPAG